MRSVSLKVLVCLSLGLFACMGPQGTKGEPGAQGEVGPRGPSGLNYKRIATVSPADTPAASGTALRSALDAITTATVDDRFIVHVEPGVYDYGTQALIVPAYVTLEGSGRSNTMVVGGQALWLSDGAEVRGITLKSTDAPGRAVGCSAAGWALREVLVEYRSTGTSGLSNAPFHCAGGVFDDVEIDVEVASGRTTVLEVFGAVTLTRSRIRASGPAQVVGVDAIEGTLDIRDTRIEAVSTGGAATGVYAQESAVSLRNTDVTASGVAVYLNGPGTVRVEHSRLTAPTPANSSSPERLMIAHTQLAGAQASGGVCYGAYDEAFKNTAGVDKCP